MKRKFNTKNNLNSSKLLHNNLTEMESLVYQEFYSRHCSNAFRGFYADAEFATKNYIEANVNLIKLFGADDEANMLLLPQTSNFGVSLIAHGWASQKIMQNERMLIFSPKQNSQLITWQKVARKTSCDLEVYNDFECSEKIISLLQRGNLRLLVLPLYSDLCGALWDKDFINLKKVIEQAQFLGAIVLLDARNFLAYPKVVNPASLGVQAMFCSSTDFCLSPGIDLVWGKKSFTKQLEPIVFGGGSVDWVSQSGFNFSRDKSRLEPGTPNLPQVLSLSEAAKHLITLSE